MGLIINGTSVNESYAELKKKQSKELDEFFKEAIAAGYIYDEDNDLFKKNPKVKACEVIVSAMTTTGPKLVRKFTPVTQAAYEDAKRSIDRQDKALAFRILKAIVSHSLDLLNTFYDVFGVVKSIDEIRGFGPACVMNFIDGEMYEYSKSNSDFKATEFAGSYEIVTSFYHMYITYFEMTRDDYDELTSKLNAGTERKTMEKTWAGGKKYRD